MSLKLHVPFSTLSPRKLKVDPSMQKFAMHKPEDLMAETDRYGFKSARKSNLDKKHPPKLSPRANNRSVDPRTRNSNMIDAAISLHKGEKNWGGTGGHLQFQRKKQSLPNYNGMTSKYELKDDGTESHGGDSTRKAGHKTLKFKDESPTLTERGRTNSGDLIQPKNISSLKNPKFKLNDSSSK